MRRAGKEEFYEPIYRDRLNVHPTIITGFPYTSDWKYQGTLTGKTYGRTVDILIGGMIQTEYYLYN